MRLNFRILPILCTTLFEQLRWHVWPDQLFLRIFYETFTEQKIRSVYLFYTMVQKSKKWPKSQINGGGGGGVGSCLDTLHGIGQKSCPCTYWPMGFACQVLVFRWSGWATDSLICRWQICKVDPVALYYFLRIYSCLGLVVPLYLCAVLAFSFTGHRTCMDASNLIIVHVLLLEAGHYHSLLRFCCITF